MEKAEEVIVHQLFVNIRDLDRLLSVAGVAALDAATLEQLTLALGMLHDRVSCGWRLAMFPGAEKLHA